MSLTVVGSIALDTVTTPAGQVSDALGGSAVYFSVVASLFTPVRVVGVVGQDFPREHLDLLLSRNIDLSDLQVAPGKTFRWAGKYGGDMAVAETLDTQLNVFGDFEPRISEASAASEYLFLANIHPSLQRRVRSQVQSAKLVFCDTMNLWIRTALEELKALLGEVSGVVLNDQEARMLTGEENLVVAGKRVLDMGPRALIIKKGEHGAMVFAEGRVANLPAFPLGRVVDPTGAGDSFAGGMMGYLAANGGELSLAGLKRAVAHGIVVASFCCEAFSLDRTKRLSYKDVASRMAAYREMLAF
jgi:sugar/nucleoside kinase (ribokinase family)